MLLTSSGNLPERPKSRIDDHKGLSLLGIVSRILTLCQQSVEHNLKPALFSKKPKFVSVFVDTKEDDHKIEHIAELLMENRLVRPDARLTATGRRPQQCRRTHLESQGLGICNCLYDAIDIWRSRGLLCAIFILLMS